MTVRSPLADAEIERYKNGAKDDVTVAQPDSCACACACACACSCSCSCSCLARQCPLFACYSPPANREYARYQQRENERARRKPPRSGTAKRAVQPLNALGDGADADEDSLQAVVSAVAASRQTSTGIACCSSGGRGSGRAWVKDAGSRRFTVHGASTGFRASPEAALARSPQDTWPRSALHLSSSRPLLPLPPSTTPIAL